METGTDTQDIDTFITRWENSGANERANYQLFLSELCELLELPPPDPATPETEENAYVFERAVTFRKADGTTAPGRIDLYKRNCFVLEAKQGSETGAARAGHGRRGSPGWEQSMIRARNQADRYVRALPAEEGRPPFLLVADIGYVIEVFAEFSRSGGTYLPFPGAGTHRLALSDLRKPDIRERLRRIWTDPLALDPSRRAARVTREVADKLAKLAVSLEGHGAEPHLVARFLMRCLFTMFAEDVNLLGKYGFQPFTRLLEDIAEDPASFVPMIEELWSKMNTGGYSTALRLNLLQFNGGLFAEAKALPLDKHQIRLLIDSAKCDWREVEPAIFGTLLERALDPVERHKLGAHYTPRAYVERLVLPTVIAPVREEWDAVVLAAVKHDNDGKRKDAIKELKAFHRRLCHLRILDPACGSGNFLYVTLEHLKRIEGEVLDTLTGFGETQSQLDMAGESVDPHQLLGIEVNPRAAAIAELVLWIGALQWHFRNRGNVMPPQPIIRDFKNIECRDALLDWDALEPVLDEHGNPVTHWDGRSTKPHPVTGREVPDESARTPEVRYRNPRKAAWPETDYIIGNPPFIGASRMRDALGDGYTDTVRKIHKDIAESSDFVMYWWNHAAELVAQGKVQRFGFVTTNSLRQTFNRRVIEKHLNGKQPVHLAYAVPDHPWVDDGAAVRIAMTTLAPGTGHGTLHTVTSEHDEGTDGYTVEVLEKTGPIGADLTIGPDVASAVALKGNSDLSNHGVIRGGEGFLVTEEKASELGLGQIPGLEKHIRPIVNGKDLTQKLRGMFVIDMFGLSEAKLQKDYPEVYQHLLTLVKPIRAESKRATRRENWWLFNESVPKLRKMLEGLPRFISTSETAKHRIFVFLDHKVLPEHKLVNIALDNGYFLGVLTSRIHVAWAMKTGGNLGVGNDSVYVKSKSFETFPFPDPTPAQRERIATLAEQLDAHRKRQQARHPDLTMTGMYNVLEKLRSGEPLTAKDKAIHEQGLVSVLKQLHDDLDAAVAAAYNWPPDLPEETILQNLVDLNKQRALEETQGHIRYLRPDYQNPQGPQATQEELITSNDSSPDLQPLTSDLPKLDWPKTLPEQIRAVRTVLTSLPSNPTPTQVTKCFKGARKAKVEEILGVLTELGT